MTVWPALKFMLVPNVIPYTLDGSARYTLIRLIIIS